MKTTFFTCCNKEYEGFVPIFIHSVLYHNDVDIEICLEDESQLNESDNSIVYIKKCYPDSTITLRKANFKTMFIENKQYKIIPNVVRFIETPTIKNDYVYICDIDIIILQKQIEQIHIDFMNKIKSDYSNLVRPSLKKRLTGLHFCKWDSYYPIPNYDDLAEILCHDEHFLYYLVKKKNEIIENTTFRPVHGIHASQNREDINAWGISSWSKQWLVYRQSSEFFHLEKMFSSKISKIIKRIDNYYDSKDNASSLVG